MLKSFKARAAAGVVVVLSAGVLLGMASSASAASNADNATACQKGGWQSLYESTGASFKGQGDCVSYAARGGQPFSVPDCFDSTIEFISDTELVLPIDVLNNVANWEGESGSCDGNFIAAYTTWVYAADASEADAKCQTITGTDLGGNVHDDASIPAAPSNWWFCVRLDF